MEYENKYASKGLSGTALGIAIGSGVLGLANGGLGNIFSGNGNGHCNGYSRYDAEKDAEIASLRTDKKFLESTIYTDSKIADVFERLSGRINCLEGQMAQQAVYNATNTATLNCISAQVAQLQALTKVVIPIDSICPEPMRRFNSWAAPVTTAPEVGA